MDVMTSLLPFIIVWIADLEVCSTSLIDPDLVQFNTVAVVQATVSSILFVDPH
jgi:hypothetical protein